MTETNAQMAERIEQAIELHAPSKPDAEDKLIIAALRAGAQSLRAGQWQTAWAVQPVEGEYRHPCIFGKKAEAVAALDHDERVVQIEYRVLPQAPSQET